MQPETLSVRTHSAEGLSSVEVGLTHKVICIKLQVIPSDTKLSQIFNCITCHFVSVEEKTL